MKFRIVVPWVQAPPGQSLASRPVARLAVVSVMGWLMRSQADDSAADNSPEISVCAGAQGVIRPESSSLGGDNGEPTRNRRGRGLRRGRRGSHSNLGRPMTFLRRLRDRGPANNPNAPSGSGRLPGRSRTSVHAKVGTPREDRRRSRVKARKGLAGLADEAWESDGCIRATMVGNGRHPDPAEQRRPVPRESFRRET